MVQKFRKKPVVIEAIQLTLDNLDAVIHFCGSKIKSHQMTGVVIETSEGNMIANNGDWIIKGVNGEFYPCKPDIFEKTYESVDTQDMKIPIVLFDRSLLRDELTNEDLSKKITVINK
jgi:hypothetical protein